MDAESVTRWVKDRVRSYNDEITEHPKKALTRLEKGAEKLGFEERNEALKHLQHYAYTYYVGRHQNEAMPPDVQRRFRELDERITRMNAVDLSREYIKKMGPPEKVFAGLMEQSRQKRAVQSALASSFDQRVRLNVSPELKPSLDKRAATPTPEVEQKKTATRSVGIGR